MDEIIIDCNYLESPLCDIWDVKETLVSLDVDRNTIKKIEYVGKFLESLWQERYVIADPTKSDGDTISIVIDQKKLSNCISKLSEVKAELDEYILNQPKYKRSDDSVEDCIKYVLWFLQYLKTNS